MQLVSSAKEVIEVAFLQGKPEITTSCSLRNLTRGFVRRLVRCNRRGLHRRIDQLENHGCDNGGSEVGYQVNPDVCPAGNAEKANAESDSGIKRSAGNVANGECAGHHRHADG